MHTKLKIMKDNKHEETTIECKGNQSRDLEYLDSEEYKKPEDLLSTFTTIKLILLMIAITFVGVLFANNCRHWSYYYEIITTTLFGFISVYACICVKREYPWYPIMVVCAVALFIIYLLPWILALILSILNVNYNFIC